MSNIIDFTFFKLVEVIEFIDCERRRMDWPIKRLAHHSGVSNNTLGRTFALKNEPTYRHIVAMLDALGFEFQIVPKQKAGPK